MSSYPSSKSEKDWQAEDDFRSLCSAQEVTSDSGRHSRARRAGKRIVTKESKALGLKRQLIRGKGKR